MKIEKFDPERTFFTSDPHYNHQSIVLGSTAWVTPPYPYDRWPSAAERLSYALSNGLRDFATTELMNETLVAGINNTVGQEDTLFCLGDWSFGGKDNVEGFRKRIICENVHLILGNHDHHIADISKNLQCLFSSVTNYREILIGKYPIVLSHYSQRVWNRSHHGALHLYGHSHSNLEKLPHGKSMDVGVDNAYKLLGEYRPFSFKEVLSMLNSREIVFLDHHTRDTRQ